MTFGGRPLYRRYTYARGGVSVCGRANQGQAQHAQDACGVDVEFTDCSSDRYDLVIGSPAGNGMHHRRFLKAADTIESTITGLGTQRNRCVAETARVGEADR